MYFLNVRIEESASSRARQKSSPTFSFPTHFCHNSARVKVFTFPKINLTQLIKGTSKNYKPFSLGRWKLSRKKVKKKLGFWPILERRRFQTFKSCAMDRSPLCKTYHVEKSSKSAQWSSQNDVPKFSKTCQPHVSASNVCCSGPILLNSTRADSYQHALLKTYPMAIVEVNGWWTTIVQSHKV